MSCEAAREAVPDDAARLRRGRAGRLPGREQVLERPGRAAPRAGPRLEQVVVERHVVDRCDRRLGVGVGGQQDALGVRDDRARLERDIVVPDMPGMRWSAISPSRPGPARPQLGQQLEGLSPASADAVALTGAAGESRATCAQHAAGSSSTAQRSRGDARKARLKDCQSLTKGPTTHDHLAKWIRNSTRTRTPSPRRRCSAASRSQLRASTAVVGEPGGADGQGRQGARATRLRRCLTRPSCRHDRPAGHEGPVLAGAAGFDEDEQPRPTGWTAGAAYARSLPPKG